MPAKPRKWGYKLFVLSAGDGFSHNFEIYTGQENVLDEDGIDLGASGNVVVRLCKILKDDYNKLYFDNYYTSVPLMVYLHQKNILALGTLRKNRVPKNPLPNDKVMNKKDRGFYEEFISSIHKTPLILLVWKDTKIVNLLSMFVGSFPETTVKRMDRKLKEKVNVTCPNIITQYNRHMGGVDLLDSHMSRYRILLRSKKWYIKLFYHLLDLTFVNAWLLWKKSDVNNKMTLAEFKEEVSIVSCKMGERTPTRGRPSTNSSTPGPSRGRPAFSLPKDCRCDHGNHLPIKTTEQQKCRMAGCKLKSCFKCTKCNIFSCIKEKNCYNEFHIE